ncbi:PAS domain S-box protein [Methanomethylovorans sp.]|uniref:PAS domain S-box protein n=1 Tax=Methanomethylovorans sp. TaxID=2758717 RepID=UPI00351C49EC
MEKYKQIVSSTQDGISLLDRDYRYTIVNSAYEHYSGKKKEEIVGLTVAEYLGEEVFNSHFRDNFDKCLKGESIRYQTWVHYPTLGKRFVDVAYFPYRDKESKISGVVANTRDITEYRLAEEALLESEANLNEVQSIAGVGSFVWDLQDDSLQYSRNMLVMAGLCEGTFPDRMDICINNLVHPEDRRFVEEEIKEMIKQCRTWPMEFRVVRPDGKERIWQSCSRFVLDESGTPVKCIGMHRDITEQRESEEQTHLLASLLATSPASVTVHDLEGNILYLNPNTYKMHGYSQEDMEYFNLQQLDDPETAQKIPERMQKIIEEGGASFEVYHLKRDGTRFPLQVRAKLVRWQGKNVVLSIALDITNQKLAEEKLQKSESKYRLLVENQNDLVIHFDPEGCILFVNPNYCAVFDKSESDLVGSTFLPLIHEEDQSGVKESLLKVLAPPYSTQHEERVMTRDGWRWFAWSAKAVLSGNGQVTSVISVGRDITLQKRSEEALRVIAETSVSSEKDIFSVLVRQLAVSQDMRHALIARVDPDDTGTAHTIAVWSNGKYAENFSYSLEGTPCRNITTHGPCFYPSDITDLFPQDHLLKEIGAESYWGTPLRDSRGRTFGLLAVLDNKPMDESPQTLSLLNSFAARAAAEMERQQTEKELKEQEHLLGKIFEILPVGLWLADKNGRLLRGNPAGVKIWGAEPHVNIEEYGVFKARRLPSEEELAPDDWALAHTITEGVTVENELLEIDAFDGKKRTILNYTAPVINDDGSMMGAIVVNSDITDLKDTEKALKTSEKLFKTLFEQAAVGVSQVSPDGHFLKVNTRLSTILGYSTNELVRKNFRDITHPEDLHLDEKYISLVLAGEIDSFEVEKRFIHKNGHHIWAKLYSKVIKDENGSILYAIGVIADITEQKKYEEAIKESQERLSLSMEASQSGFWDLDLDNNKMYLSSQIYDMNGYGAEELPENMDSLMNLAHPDDRKIVDSTIGEAIIEVKPFHVDFRIMHRSGEWIWISAKGKPVEIDEYGKPHRLIGTQVNVTPRVKAEEALVYAKVAADYSNRIREEFLKNVTHELRTPLSAVIGFSDVLLEQSSENLSESQKEYVRYIHQSGKNLHQIINKMLDLSQYESGNTGKLQLQRMRFDLTTREIVGLLMPKAAKKSIKVNTKISSAYKEILADEHKFKEIIYNLLDNAIKFTPDGGSISIETTANNGMLQISICDTGIGIEKASIDKIFDPFIQIDGSISRKYGGVGLGLALVKRFVEMHSGNIYVNSEPGKGSTFTIEIPLNREKEQHPAPIGP